MIIGTIKEIKNNENRVGLTPEGVKMLVLHGHKAIVQKASGLEAGFSDEEYGNAGAELADTALAVAEKCDLLVKVKEPLPSEYYLLKALEGKALFTYLHLAAAKKQLSLELVKNNITAIAYETVEDKNSALPLLAPMSEIAGVLAIQFGANYLQKRFHGRGITLGKISNAEKAIVAIIGAGTVGAKSAETAAGMGCKVILLEKNTERIKKIKKEFGNSLGAFARNIQMLEATEQNITESVKKSDLLVGAVLVKGAVAPKVVSEAQLKLMKKGAVIVDVAIDQGGCIFGSKATTHENPIFEIDGKIFCCVANMPGQVPLQATQALTAATLPYILRLADNGIANALKKDKGFAKGLNAFKGKITNKQVADALGLEYSEADL